jgi:hypothetical protein
MCLFLVICVYRVWLSGGYQGSQCRQSVNDLGVPCTGVAVGTTLPRGWGLGTV